MSRPLKIKKVSASDPASRAATRILRTRLREFYSHWPDPEQKPTPEQLHDQRISGKRLRYSAENLRDLYPDRLALLIDLLKRQQDLLGEMQDCITHRRIVAADLARRRRKGASDTGAEALEALLERYDKQHARLYAELRDIWRGMTRKRFRRFLEDLVSRPRRRASKESTVAVLAIDQAGDEAGAEAVVDVHDGNV